MDKGKLKFFDTSRGFGFIEPLDGSEDVFLHANNIAGMTSGDDLREGQTIEYETEKTEKGLSAINASPADDPLCKNAEGPFRFRSGPFLFDGAQREHCKTDGLTPSNTSGSSDAYPSASPQLYAQRHVATRGARLHLRTPDTVVSRQDRRF